MARYKWNLESIPVTHFVMGSRLVWMLLVAGWGLATSLPEGSRNDCCTDIRLLKFEVKHGNCGAVNAKRVDHLCEVTVCGDGRPLVGSYCGRGPCNIFGCNCDGGCLFGDFAESFMANHPDDGIRVIDASTQSYWRFIWSFVTDVASVLSNILSFFL